MTPELTALVTRLRSRAWEDRQHRELRELAAQAIVDLSRALSERNDLTPTERESSQRLAALLAAQERVRELEEDIKRQSIGNRDE